MKLLVKLLTKVVGKVIEYFDLDSDTYDFWGYEERPTLEEQSKNSNRVMLNRLRAITYKDLPDDFKITERTEQLLNKYSNAIDDTSVIRKELERIVC